MLRQDNGGAQLTVDLPQQRQEIRRCNGVELGRRLIQHQYIGLHSHDGGEAQQLLLSPRKVGDILIKPVLNAEKGGDLRHAASNGGGIAAQALQAKGQLVPHLIGDHLILGGLEDIANPLCLFTGRDVPQPPPAVGDFPREEAVRGETGLQVPQQGGLSAARRAAENDKFPLLHREGHIPQHALFSLGIGKIYRFECIAFHARSSAQWIATGIIHKIQ